MERYISGYDKAKKPYRPIDTSSPAGTWIEEKRYNKGRPTASSGAPAAQGGGRSRKVLCGNWQEEAALEGDMLRIEAEEQQQGGTTTLGGTAMSAAGRSVENRFGASLDVIKDVGGGRYAGGFESSPYLTADGSLAAGASRGARQQQQQPLMSTHRADFNATSSNVLSQRRPPLGVRGQLQLEQSLAAAREAQSEAMARTAARQAAHAQRTGAAIDPATVYTTSTYAATISAARAHESTSHDKEVIDELRQEYLSDEPITLYTGNPETGRTMTVHGRTPEDPMSSTRFGRHTYFTRPKYAI